MPGREEHLLAREDQLNGTADVARRKRHMRPGSQAGAEGAANERANDLHILRRQAENCSNLPLFVHDETALAPQGQSVAVPHRARCMRLHRVICVGAGSWVA